MRTITSIIEIGNMAGIIIPARIVKNLKIKSGDRIFTFTDLKRKEFAFSKKKINNQFK